MPKAASSESSSLPRRIKQFTIAAVAIAALIFAVQGGEYGTRDLMRQRARKASLVRTNDSLQHIIDSLRTYKKRVETDPVLQERIAREEFGMVRGNKEILYRFTEPERP
jgi:cell division protein FtsB